MSHRPLARAGLSFAWVAAGAAVLLLPAVLAGHPFVYWDTPTFYSWGHDILAALRHPWPPLDRFPADRGLWAADNMPGAWHRITPQQFQLVLTSVGARSSFYAVPLYVLGSLLTPWALAAAQALLVSWLVWTALRVTCPRAGAGWFVALMAGLTVATPASFYAGFLMPDIFAALAILAASLVLGFSERLGRVRTLGCAAVLTASTLVHLSVAPTVVALVVLGPVLLRVLAPGAPVWRGAAVSMGALAVAAVASVGAGMGLRSAFGEAVRSPPFVEARVIVDGPGRAFLQQACASRPFVACRYKDMAVPEIDDIMWPDVSWDHLPLVTDPVLRRRFLDEQVPVVLGTLRTHPLEQLAASAHNAWLQIRHFGFSSDITTSLTGLLTAGSDRTMRLLQMLPGLRRCEADHGRSCDETGLARSLDGPFAWVVGLSVVALVGVAGRWLLLRPADPAAAERRRLSAFAALLAAGVLANDVTCGVLSGPWGRYQGRVIWLLPMAAALLAGRWAADHLAARMASGSWAPRYGLRSPGRALPVHGSRFNPRP